MKGCERSLRRDGIEISTKYNKVLIQINNKYKSKLMVVKGGMKAMNDSDSTRANTEEKRIVVVVVVDN